jgi:hypothetical protein
MTDPGAATPADQVDGLLADTPSSMNAASKSFDPVRVVPE